MGVGQWTSLLMIHEFMTTPSKLNCVLSTLHPKHNNARGGTNYTWMVLTVRGTVIIIMRVLMRG